MIRLNFSGIGGIKKIQKYEKKLMPFIKAVDKRQQDFYRTIDDWDLAFQIEKYVKSIKGKYKEVVVLGIGGSALGARLLQGAFQPVYGAREIRLHVVDSIDPVLISELEEHLNLRKTLFLVVSKSGNTIETLSQYFLFRKKTDLAALEAKDHFVFITDPKEGFLRKISEEDEILVFDVPEKVGGRFSVLTAVGLLPAALMGVDISGMLEGAREMRDRFLSDDFDNNLCFQLSALQFMACENGKNSTVLMPYSERLKNFSDWFKQLWAESTGKISASGKNVGCTPISALGVADQHSLLQLFMEGPDDKLFMFLTVTDFDHDFVIPVPHFIGGEDRWKDVPFHFLEEVSFEKLLKIECRATIDSLTEKKRDNMVIELEKIDAKTMGALVMLFEGAAAFLGEFLEINVFDQPGVERGKELTRKYLVEE